MFRNSPQQFLRALQCATCQGSHTRFREGESLPWCQARKFTSSNWYNSRRNQQASPSNREEVGTDLKIFKQRMLEEDLKRRPPGQKKPSEYRQLTIEKSTKNMALVPKKWKRALPSREVVDAVTYLRRAKHNPDAVQDVFQKRVNRMLKLEMMLLLSELQRLNEWILARQVFNAIRRESWYKPDVYLYQTMVQMFERSKQIKEAEKMCEELEAEGLQPDDSIRRELLRAYVSCNMIVEAVKLYKEMQESSFRAGTLDKAARSILFHGLNPEDKQELALYEKSKGYDWS